MGIKVRIGILQLLLTPSLILGQNPDVERFKYSHLDMAVVKLYVNTQPVGSGFVIDGPFLVTNFHVVKEIIDAKRQNISVQDTIRYQNALFSNHGVYFEGERLPIAEVLPEFIDNDTIYNYAKYTDLAVLHPPKDLNLTTTLPLSQNYFVRSSEILVAGFPLGLSTMNISKGIVGNTYFKYGIPKQILKILPFAGVSLGQGDYISAPGSSGGPVIKLGPTKEQDSVIGVVYGGRRANAADIKYFFELYKSKYDSIVEYNGSANLSNAEESRIVEKYTIFSSLINSNVQIPEFVNVYHLSELLELLKINVVSKEK